MFGEDGMHGTRRETRLLGLHEVLAAPGSEWHFCTGSLPGLDIVKSLDYYDFTLSRSSLSVSSSAKKRAKPRGTWLTQYASYYPSSLCRQFIHTPPCAKSRWSSRFAAKTNQRRARLSFIYFDARYINNIIRRQVDARSSSSSVHIQTARFYRDTNRAAVRRRIPDSLTDTPHQKPRSFTIPGHIPPIFTSLMYSEINVSCGLPSLSREYMYIDRHIEAGTKREISFDISKINGGILQFNFPRCANKKLERLLCLFS